MLIVALVVKKQVARFGHGTFPTQETTVFMDQRLGRYKILAVAFQRHPAIAQRLLLRKQVQLRRQATPIETIGLTPTRVVRPQGFSHRKAKQSGTIPMKPAGRWTALDLFGNDKGNPVPETIRLLTVKHAGWRLNRITGSQGLR